MKNKVEITKKKYGLRHKKTGELAKIESYSNSPDSEFCGDSTYALEQSGNRDWLVDDIIPVLFALKYTNTWYNSSEEYPVISIKPEDYEIVEIEIKEIHTVVETPHIPDVKEIIEKNYEDETCKDEYIKMALENYKEANDKKKLSFISPSSFLKYFLKKRNHL
jgi:hypothetical protein